MYDGLVLGLKVVDKRPIAGDNAQTARAVGALPFRDSGDSGNSDNPCATPSIHAV